MARPAPRPPLPRLPSRWALGALHEWAESLSARSRALGLPPDGEATPTLSWVLSEEDLPQGRELADSPVGRAFLGALWAADAAAYPSPVDRVELARLAWVVSTFPQGFRLVLAEDAAGDWLPVGYTGWYPIAANTLELLLRHPDQLRHRGQVAPLAAVEPGCAVYLFNYSITALLRRSRASRALLGELAAALPPLGEHRRCALTVSADGARVAARFGLERRGTAWIGGEAEGVFVSPDGGVQGALP
jgi:hypothetical protein